MIYINYYIYIYIYIFFIFFSFFSNFSDRACLFFMSPLIAKILPNQDRTPEGADGAKPNRGPLAESLAYFPNTDIYRTNTPTDILATNIYKCKDGRFFHLHGKL